MWLIPASIVELTQRVMFVVVAVVLMRALVVAHRNAERISGAPLPHSAMSTVSWWFVPIANVFVPFRRVREIRRSSTLPGLDPIAPSKAIGIWKQSWIGAIVFAPLMAGGTASWAELRAR